MLAGCAVDVRLAASLRGGARSWRPGPRRN